MKKDVENKQAATANKQRPAKQQGEQKVWRLKSPQGRPYLTSDPIEARHLINTLGYTEVSK